MSETFRPETVEQLRDLLVWAGSEGKPVELIGTGSKRALGRPVNADCVVALDRMAGITLHEPDELVLSARPATPLAEIEAVLAAARQQLEFEPPDYGPLLEAPTAVAGKPTANAGKGTIGGLIACNLAGPRRIKAGAARDHFLGFHGVSGRGEIFKSGGRVVKNVTGYDLSKLMAGSWGTLTAMTDLTVKVMPVPEKTRTVLLFGANSTAAGAVMSTALQSPHDVSGAAWLPADLASGSAVSEVSGLRASVTAIRVEGPGPSVEYRCAALREIFGALGPTQELHSANSAVFWREIRDVAPFARPGDRRAVWKISVAPMTGPKIVVSLAAVDGVDTFMDWGGGLVWLALPEGTDAGLATVRAVIPEGGGHATLLRASEAVRRRVEVFQPLEAGHAALTRRVKAAFDPRGILNPGRIHADM